MNTIPSTSRIGGSPTLEVEQRGQVRLLRLNRPARRNALDDELGWGLVHALSDAQADPDTAVIALTGNGSAFCAGLDLRAERDLQAHSGMSEEDVNLDDLRWISRFLLTIRQRCDKPVVAGINGPAVGAGLALAMACDLRIMAASATLMSGYARVGGAPDGGLSLTLLEAVGYERALRLLLEVEPIDAVEARSLGLVGEVVDDVALLGCLVDYCQSLAGISHATLRLTKRSLRNAARHQDLEGHLRYELANLQKAFSTDVSYQARQSLNRHGDVPRGQGNVTG